MLICVYMVLFFFVLMLLYIFKENFFMILMSFEFMLVYLTMIYMMLNTNLSEDWLFLYILIMGVCESVIGISLMISLVYDEGNQGTEVLNLNW